MIRFWVKFDNFFLKKEGISSSYDLRKARLLSMVHIFIAFTCIISLFFSFFVTPTPNLPAYVGLFCTAIYIYLFKKYGNFSLSGNLIAAGFPIALVSTVIETGGLHSDNLFWLLLAPMLAMLFGSRNSGFIWLIFLEFFTGYLYDLEFKNPIPLSIRLMSFPASYYWVSYSLLFMVIVSLVYIFRMGQDEIIRDLRENHQVLENQKKILNENNDKLKELSGQLQKSNSELETFAYAASHDLKEPLRMIGMYTTLLQRRMGGNLSEENLEFMGYVTDGVNRMQRMLDDLLEYSRIGHSNDGEKAVDLNKTLFLVQNNLKVRIQETEATIENITMPIMMSRSTEMIQLFQNLIGNALKFRKKDLKPVVEVNWVIDREMVVFGIRDNGIGIAEEYLEKVFAIFQRLHNKSDYEGSGIGLATCKKIVENLGGTIWVRSKLDVGTTFLFSIPLERMIGSENEKVDLLVEVEK
jgi:signal transduction histidine kinase